MRWEIVTTFVCDSEVGIDMQRIMNQEPKTNGAL